MKEVLNVTVAFAAGALAVTLLDRTVRRRRSEPVDEPVGDAQLREEVRSRLGEWVSHPDAIEVSVSEHVVRLAGRVLAPELDGLLSHVKGVRGVRSVRNALSVLNDPGAFAELRTRAPAERDPALPEWTPSI